MPQRGARAAKISQSATILTSKTKPDDQPFEATMIILSAVRDFADGLSRGFSLFFTERNDHTIRTLPMPINGKRK